MAYRLIAEFESPPDWVAVHAALVRVQGLVELFPIDQEGAAVGLAIPQKVAREAVPDLASVLSVLEAHGAVTTDLYSGMRVDQTEWVQVVARLSA